LADRGEVMSQQKTMTELAREYLNKRRDLGYVLQCKGEELLSFARYADQIGHEGSITTTLAVQWATLPQGVEQSHYVRRLDNVRQFARYLALSDNSNEIPPYGILGPSYQRKPPYIFSDEEISVLLESAADLVPIGGLRSHTYVTLFGLLVSTGLRISEALNMKHNDVDLANKVLTISNSKFKKSRLVPIHSTTQRVLINYARNREKIYPFVHAETFFVGDRGLPLKYSAVSATFKRMRKRLGWTQVSDRAPRIHDLRHTFAVRRLLSWYKEGVTVENKIVSLSTYLGHVRVKDTYWYFSAVPELLSIISSRFESSARLNLRSDS
jgi:site-specific recombinase XerD